MGSRILIVDDNQEIREAVIVLLENEGYEMEEVGDGEAAVAKAKGMDSIILDVTIPKMDGLKACRQIREVTNTPVLLLIAEAIDQDKVFESSNGRDGCLVKPFSCNELIARMKALLRRYCIYKGREEPQEDDQIIMHDLIISRSSNQVKKKEEAVNLMEMEYQILLLSADHPKGIFSSQELYEAIWKGPYMYSANSIIMVHIRSLRRKLGVDPRSPVYIETVRGEGCRLG